jgi:excisionase family DNA binding protein
MPRVEHPKVSLADLEREGRTFARVWETAQIMEADERTILTLLAKGEIPGTRLGASWRIPVAWLRTAASAQAQSGGHERLGRGPDHGDPGGRREGHHMRPGAE